ncbi:hypothetical protein IWX49DRAFT_12702 [Phyllosticta citricarpa]
MPVIKFLMASTPLDPCQCAQTCGVKRQPYRQPFALLLSALPGLCAALPTGPRATHCPAECFLSLLIHRGNKKRETRGERAPEAAYLDSARGKLSASRDVVSSLSRPGPPLPGGT